MGDKYVHSLEKAFAILNVLVFEDLNREGISLSELSKRVGIPSNTLHNLLKTMIHCGYAAQKEDSTYISGPKCLQIGMVNQIHLSKNKINKIYNILQNLKDDIGESVVFYILSNGERVPLIYLDTNDMIKVDYTKIRTQAFFKFSTGRILAAYASDYELDQILNRWGYPGEIWENINDRESLDKACEKIREKGYYEMIFSDTVAAFAFPVMDRTGKLIGAVGSYLPVFRCDREKRALILEKLKNAVELASRSI